MRPITTDFHTIVTNKRKGTRPLMTCGRVLRRGPSFFVAVYQVTNVSVNNFEIWRFLTHPCKPRSNFNSLGAFMKSTCLSFSYDKAPYSLLEDDRIDDLRIDAVDLTHQASGVRDKMAVKFPNYPPCGPLGSIYIRSRFTKNFTWKGSS